MKTLIISMLILLSTTATAQTYWDFSIIEDTKTQLRYSVQGELVVYDNKNMSFNINNTSTFLSYISHKETTFENQRVTEVLLQDEGGSLSIFYFVEAVQAIMVFTEEKTVWLLQD